MTGIIEQLPLLVLFLVIAFALGVIVKGADLLVDQAVALSLKWGVPKMLIGATIVSIGTTLPEAAVSVLAAVQGAPGLALGNAVGSIIADTGLILGMAAIIGRVPIDRTLVSRQSWIQISTAVLLILAGTPFLSLGTVFKEGGRMPQFVGVVFLGLLLIYLWRSIAVSRNAPPDDFEAPGTEAPQDVRPFIAIFELALGIAMVVIGSRVLIPTVEETALRLNIPDSIIAATLVAFGTSLPELVTAVTAVRKGHGELAIGNVLGADVLNVLFVSGAAAAVTTGGLQVPPQFFYLFYPSMMFVVLVLRLGIRRNTREFSTGFGVVLLVAYAITVVLGYLIPGVPAPAAMH